MLAVLSKAVTSYLASLLAFLAMTMTLIALLAPTLLLQDKVALLKVTPFSFEAVSSNGTDGPNVFLGALGSCSRINNATPLNCTIANTSPQYDLSVLPSEGRDVLLSVPTASAPIVISVAIACNFLFFISYSLVNFHHRTKNGLRSMVGKPLFQRLSAWFGFFGFSFGLTFFVLLRIWFGKAVQKYNSGQGQQDQRFLAETGNAFTIVWAAYAFYAVPVVASLAKLHVNPRPVQVLPTYRK